MFSTIDYIALATIILYNLILSLYFVITHKKKLKKINATCKTGKYLWCINQQNEPESVKCLKVIPFNKNSLFIRYCETSSGNIYQSVLGKQIWLTEKEAINYLLHT